MYGSWLEETSCQRHFEDNWAPGQGLATRWHWGISGHYVRWDNGIMVTQEVICSYFQEVYTKNFRDKSHDIGNLKKYTSAKNLVGHLW